VVLTVVILLAVEIGGFLVIWAILRERVRREASAASQARELREEVGRLVVELDQTTERNVALVEDAMSRLNELLARTDKKIGLLAREADRHDGGMRLYGKLAAARQAAGPAVTGAASSTTAAGPASEAARAPSAPAPRGPRQDGDPEGGLPTADPRAEVALLARQGFAPALIASRVGLPLGEVELIAAIEQRRRSGVEPGSWNGGSGPSEEGEQ
jgi:hypothetical protein